MAQGAQDEVVAGLAGQADQAIRAMRPLSVRGCRVLSEPLGQLQVGHVDVKAGHSGSRLRRCIMGTSVLAGSDVTDEGRRELTWPASSSPL